MLVWNETASGHMLWPWAIWRLFIKPGHWNDPEVKLTILSGIECSGLYVVKRLMSFQHWWWHCCVIGGSLHAWLRCNALYCIGQVTQPFLDCGRMYWYVSASWSCMLKRVVLYIECTCTHALHWNVHMHVCAYTYACMYVQARMHALVLSGHYLPWVAVSVVIQLCWTQWVRRLTKLSKLYMFSPFYHRYHCSYEIYLILGLVFSALSMCEIKHMSYLPFQCQLL